MTGRISGKRDFIQRRLSAARGLPSRRVLLLYELEELYSAGKGSWPGDMIRLCRAVNIAAEAPSPWPKLSLEGVAAADPEVLLLAVPSDAALRDAVRERIAGLSSHPVWQHVNAVKQNRVVMVDKALLSVPGPRVIDALGAVSEAIYPEVFANAD